jgi:hypothetical protein
LLAKETVVEAAPLDCGANVTVKVALCPAARVTGNESPLIENSELPTSAEETTTLAPVAVSVPVWDPLFPTVTLPRAMVDGLTLSCPEEDPTADPLKLTFKLGFDAFDVIETLPVKFPEDCGANLTVNDVVCPGLRVIGVLAPETLNPVPVVAMSEMVAFDPPVFCTVSVCVCVLPVITSANDRLTGIAARVAGVAALVPVPESATSKVVLDPLTVSDKLPLLVPAAVGAN